MQTLFNSVASDHWVAQKALAFMQNIPTIMGAGIWRYQQESWLCLASFTLEGGTLPHPMEKSVNNAWQRQNLLFNGEILGCLMWKGSPDVSLQEMANGLSASLYLNQTHRSSWHCVPDAVTLANFVTAAHNCHDADMLWMALQQFINGLLPDLTLVLALWQDEENWYFPLSIQCPSPLPGHLRYWIEQARQQVGSLHIARTVWMQNFPEEAWRLAKTQASDWLIEPLIDRYGRSMGVLVLESQHVLTQEAGLGVQAQFSLAAQKLSEALERLSEQGVPELADMMVQPMGAEGDVDRFYQKILSILSQYSEQCSRETFIYGLMPTLCEGFASDEMEWILFDHPKKEQRYQNGKHTIDPYWMQSIIHSGFLTWEVNLRRRGTVPYCAMGLPLQDTHGLYGLLVLKRLHKGDNPYSKHDQAVFKRIAGLIGFVLKQVESLESLYLAYQALEQKIRESHQQLNELQAQVEFDSQHDALTKLPNRRAFQQILHQAWKAYDTGNGEQFAVAIISLNRLKPVNHVLGDQAGDAMLFEATRRVRSCMRHYDILARLDGEELAVLLFGVTSRDICRQVGTRILKAFERPMVLDGMEVLSIASVGIVLAERDYFQRADELLRDAGYAMVCARKEGRPESIIFDHLKHINQADQLILESDLRRALAETGQIIPYFQPFVHAQTKKIVGFEALARWQHPTRGMISPGLFLPLAEESGLMKRLDRHIFNAACEQWKQWFKEKRVDERVSLHINLSPLHIYDTDLLSWIKERLNYFKLPEKVLYLEVTESALIQQPTMAIDLMKQLHDIGIRLALDDFGKGYSALSYLQHYHFDVLKIDQSFIAEINRKEESRVIVGAIVALARALGLEVVAEGVENAEQLATLQKLECNTIQGFYFARPAAAEKIDWDLWKPHPSEA